MDTSKNNHLVKGGQTALKKHSPEFLTGIGIAGMITTTVLAVKATPKALQIIDEEKEVTDQAKLKPIDTVKLTWKCYVPAAITGTTSIACLIGASSVHVKRNAALATAYTLSERAFSEYKEQVVETIGEKKEKTVREKVDKAHIEKNPVSKHEVLLTGKGETLCNDYCTNRYFKSDIDVIKQGLNRLNATLLREDYVSLNDFYDEIGLDQAGLGDEVGWNSSRVGKNLIELNISYQGADNGQPCAVISFDPMPYREYDRY